MWFSSKYKFNEHIYLFISQNIAERVLTELGMGGVQGLYDYYQTRVIKYISILRKRCHDLNDHYTKLLIPKSPSPVDKINKYEIKCKSIQ